MLLLLIIPVWAACLLLLAGLCTVARLGDSELARPLESDDGASRQQAVTAVLEARCAAPSVATATVVEQPRTGGEGVRRSSSRAHGLAA